MYTVYGVEEICLSVEKFDLNYLWTGEIDKKAWLPELFLSTYFHPS